MSGPAPRPAAWKWYICGLLLLATTVNYMDRSTLSNVATRVTREFDINDRDYGFLEWGFGLAFAVGALLFGFIADRTSVRWLYPTVLVLWSFMGFATGLVEGFWGLLACRTLLGLFEAGHWPCALKTTQRLLPPENRTMGNSILQSGTSLGAIVTPLLMSALLTDSEGSWRMPFQAIGVAGTVWVFFWLSSIRRSDLPPPQRDQQEGDVSSLSAMRKIVFSRNFLVLLVVVTAINTCWHIPRVWLPKFLQEGRGYSEKEALYFNSLYYVATDLGCIAAGLASLALHRLGLSVHRSRTLVYLICAMITGLSVLVPLLPQGWHLLGLLLLLGFGALGLFPCYYTLSQELTVKHQGKVSGLLGAFAWVFTSTLQPLLGWWKDSTGSYDLGFALAGLMPLVGFAALWLLWRHPEPTASTPTIDAH